jgi:uncharacterized protein
MDSEKNSSPLYYCWKSDQLYVDLLVHTFASHDEIVGVHGNRLKVRLASSPIAGKANEHLLKLMAEYFGVPNNRVHITKGHQSRMKQICVHNPQNNIPERDHSHQPSAQMGK